LFRLLKILPFCSQYIYSIKNMDIFISNSDTHSIHTRHGLDLHYPAYKLTKVQKGVSFTGIRIFNNLPYSMKILSNDVNKFKYSLKKFLHVGSFYSLGEYFEWKTRDDLNSYKSFIVIAWSLGVFLYIIDCLFIRWRLISMYWLMWWINNEWMNELTKTLYTINFPSELPQQHLEQIMWRKLKHKQTQTGSLLDDYQIKILNIHWRETGILHRRPGFKIPAMNIKKLLRYIQNSTWLVHNI
jgi:hypothetical protein